MNIDRDTTPANVPPDGDSISIRRMLPSDIPAGMRLKTIAGWNQTEDDWKLYLSLSPEGCFCAVSGDSVVGIVTAISYEDRISWIGMMLVDPDYRRRGIATKMMQHAMAFLRSCGTIKLDATPLGKTVFDKLGFR